MAKYTNTIQYNLKTSLDSSGISKLQGELRNVQSQLKTLANQDILSDRSVDKAIQEISKINKAFSKGFNSSLGMLDISKFSQSLDTTLSKASSRLAAMGTIGSTSFNNVLSRVGAIDTGTKQISKTTDKIFNTIGNTVRWGIVASGFQQILNSVHEAVNYVKELDTSLNNIRIVSDYSAEEMREFSLYANDAAKSLGQTTVAYTDASLIFAQQGYNLQDSEKLAELTLKVANTTGQQTAEVSEQLTSWINGYKMTADEAQETMDKVTKVAAVGASDTEELMTAAAKVASTASTLGVTEDELISQLSTIISVTREAPENVGNALKTIYARLGDLKMGETLDDGTDLGKLSGRLKEVGIEVLNTTGEMRGMGEILEDLMQKWQGFDVAQKQALAVELAGKYQYNRLMALMENQEMYQDTLEASENQSEGYLQKAQDIRMESIEAHINQLKAAGESLITTLFDGNQLAPMIDNLTNIIELMNQFVDGIGGATAAFTLLSATATRTFSNQIARGISNAISNKSAETQQRRNQDRVYQEMQKMGINDIHDPNVKNTVDFIKQGTMRSHMFDTEQIKEYNTQLEITKNAENALTTSGEKLKTTIDGINLAYGKGLLGEDPIKAKTNPKTGMLEIDRTVWDKYIQTANGADEIFFKPEDLKDMESFDKLANSSAAASKEVSRINEILFKVSSGAQLTEKEMFELGNSIELVSYHTDKMGKEFVDENAQIRSVTQAVEKMSKAYLDYGEGKINVEQMTKALHEARVEIEAMNKASVRSNFTNNIDAQIAELNQNRAAMQSINETNKAMVEKWNTQEIVREITNVIGAVGQLAFVWQEFQHMGALWAEEDTDLGEKILTTVLDLSFILPMVASGITTVIDGYKGIKAAAGAQNAIDLINIASAKVIQTITERTLDAERAITKEKITQAAIENETAIDSSTEAVNAIGEVAEQSSEGAELLEQALDGVGQKTKDLKQPAEDMTKALPSGDMLDGVSLGVDKTTKSTKKASIAFQDLGSALLLLGKRFLPILVVAAAAGALATAVSNWRKTQEEFSAKLQTDIDATKDVTDSIDKNYNSLNDLYAEYQKTGTATDELKNSSLELAKALGINNAELLVSRGLYGSLKTQIDKAIDSQLEYNHSLLEMQNSDIIRNVRPREQALKAGVPDFLYDLDAWAYQNITGKDFGLANPNMPKTDVQALNRIAIGQKDLNQRQEEYNRLLEKEKEIKASEGQQALKDSHLLEQKERLEDEIAKLESSINNETSQKLKENATALAENTFERLNNKHKFDGATLKEITDRLKAEKDINLEFNQVESREGRQAAELWLAGYTQTVVDGLKEPSSQIQDALSEWVSFNSLLDGFNDSEVMTVQTQFLNKLHESAKLSNEQKIQLYDMINWDAADFRAEIERIAEMNPVELKAKLDADNLLEQISGLITKLSEDEELENKDLAGLYDSRIVEIFEEASKQSDNFAEALTLLTDNSYEAQKSLYDLEAQAEGTQHSFNADEIEKEAKKLKDAYEDASWNDMDLADPEAQMDWLEKNLEKIEDLMDQDYSLDIDILGDSLDQLDHTIEAMNDVTDAIELIGEGFLVAAEDVDVLAETIPGILDQASVTSEGQIKLNEDVATNAIANATQRAEADAQAMKDTINNEIAYAQAKQEMYYAEAATFQTLADQKLVSQGQYQTAMYESEQRINQSSAELRTKFGTAVADVDSQITNNDQQTGQNMADVMQQGALSAESSLNQLGDSSNKIAQQVANQWNEVGLAVAAAGQGKVDSYDAGFSSSKIVNKPSIVKGTAALVKDGEVPIINATNEGELLGPILDTTWADKAQQQADALKAQGDSYGKIINSLQGALFKIGATTNTFKHAGDTVGQPKDEKGKQKKQYEPKSKDFVEEDIDLYEKVETKLAAIGEELGIIANEQDRLMGINLINNMNKQTQLLQRQVELQKEKLLIQQAEANSLRSQLASQYGVSFDTEGFINNYADVHQKLTNDVNNLIARYNSTASEAGQESLEKQIDAANKRLDDFKDIYKKYDELWASDLRATKAEIEELIDKQEDLRIEVFKTSITAADSLKDLNEGLIDFKNNLNGLDRDKPFNKMMVASQKLAGYWKSSVADSNKVYDRLIGNAQNRIASGELSPQDVKIQQNAITMWQKAKGDAAQQILDSGGFGNFDINMDLVNTMTDQINQYERTGRSEVFGKNEAALYETAKEVWEQAKSRFEEYVDLIDEGRKEMNAYIDDMFESIDRRLQIYEQIDQELEHQQSIVEILFGDKAYEKLDMISDIRIQSNTHAIELRKELLEILKQEQSAFKENSEEWLIYQDQIIAKEQEIQELGLKILEDQVLKRDHAIEELIDKSFNDILGVDSLEWTAEQWELINRNADQYLDSVNSAYELQKLQNKALKLMDNSTGVHQQEMINQFMKDNIEQLKTKDKLSQYDVAYAQAQLEILEKRLALEEAARNKSQMKLKRDAQGNYRYVYTANPEDQSTAEEDLLDAQNNAYNISKDAMVQSQQDVLSAIQDAKAALMNIWNDANLSVEEKVERMKWYIANLQEYLQNAGIVLNESQSNIINDFLAMTELTTEVSSDKLNEIYNEILEGNIDMFNKIDERWEQNYFDITGLLDNFEEYFGETGQQLEEILKNFEYQVEDTSNLVGGYFYETENALGSVTDKLNNLASTQASFINQLKNDAGVVMDYQNTLSFYEQKITNLEGAMKGYVATIERLNQLVASKEAENTQLRANIVTTPTSSSGGNNSAGLSVGSRVQLRPGSVYHYRSNGTGPTGNWSDAVKITHFNYGSLYPIHLGTENSSLAGGPGSGWRGWVRLEDLVGFNTGGYTGTWSSSEGNAEADNGKIAFLHQKELVLNENDTANFLWAIQEMRKIIEDLNEQKVHSSYNAYQDKLRSITRQLAEQDVLNSSLRTDTVSQDVHITAEFPGVNRAEEIEEALLSLNDRALQYANVKKAYDSHKAILGRIL